MAEPLVRETQKLYGLPLSQFTAARNARAKALRKSDPELAAAVAALPKPSVSAGALNELVHEDPSEVRALVQSGKRLRQAQEAAVSGKKGADLNEAIKEHRVALDRVQRDLRRRKLSATTIDRATQTLRVASLDPELWPLLERGLLYEDLTASGLRSRPRHRPRSPAAEAEAEAEACGEEAGAAPEAEARQEGRRAAPARGARAAAGGEGARSPRSRNAPGRSPASSSGPRADVQAAQQRLDEA